MGAAGRNDAAVRFALAHQVRSQPDGAHRYNRRGHRGVGILEEFSERRSSSQRDLFPRDATINRKSGDNLRVNQQRAVTTLFNLPSWKFSFAPFCIECG